MRSAIFPLLATVLVVCAPLAHSAPPLPPESGYEAWLRYPRATDPTLLAPLLRVHVGKGVSPAVLTEWTRALRGLQGGDVAPVPEAESGVVFAIDPALPAEAYRVTPGQPLRISGGDARGVLYGTFRALRDLARGKAPADLAAQSAPSVPLRILHHWDNMVVDPVMGSIERVPGGHTIFEWGDLARPNPRYEDYARLLASIGLNAVCLANVNADPALLTPDTLDGLAALADTFRPWGLQLFLSVNFATPALLDELPTADPLDPQVVAWWKAKADEIYRRIPDFGGFVVKADSEGKPGPGTYGRSHVEGATLLADALAPHGGLVLWRTFVYGRAAGLSEAAAADRANHATAEFAALDGKFPPNVILQIKLTATDFQPNEPAHTLLGRLPRTPVALEVMVAQEYSGQDVHLAWQGEYWSRILKTPVAPPPAGTVADVIEGRPPATRPGAISGTANITSAENWFGHLLAGANLFAFGRLAWDPAAEPAAIADEYAALVFGPEAAPAVASMLTRSYAVFTRYTAPLGLHHLWEQLQHFEPDPWVNPKFADASGAGTDRTAATGSGYAATYPPEDAARFESPVTCPPEFLLYFHRLPWDHPLPDGRPLVQHLYDEIARGTDDVADFRAEWLALRDRVDPGRWSHVSEKLAAQHWHARRWRDLLARFFLEQSGTPDAAGRFDAPSPHPRLQSGFPQALEDYRARVQRESEKINATP